MVAKWSFVGLLPFQHRTWQSESKNTTFEIDYILFIYDILYDYVDDIKDQSDFSLGL